MLLPIVLHRLLREGVAVGLLLALLAPLAWPQEDERVQVTFLDEQRYTDALLRLRQQGEIRRLRGKLSWEGDLGAMRTDK
jgi:hypothetical protein